MKAEITVSQLYWNPRVLDFFFRTQARENFDGFLCADATGTEQEQKNRFEWLEDNFDDVDDMEEWFYNHTLEEIEEAYIDNNIQDKQ